MQVLSLIVMLMVLTLLGFRLHTHLAVHERRVVAAWDRLDTLLTQRNGLLQQAYSTAAHPLEPLRTVHTGVQDQERSRRCGDLPKLAAEERAIRSAWDRYLHEIIDYSGSSQDRLDVTRRRVAALDQAITEALSRYNAAVSAFTALRRHWAYGPLARLTGYTAFDPVRPPPPPEH
ncbi:hypothetical protein [Thioalkalivibrio sp.]|uniref:hypothetical protein n=1 Tax=Thioalkalivibrio sp. TaxID=2093813 RepID=UPI0035672A86